MGKKSKILYSGLFLLPWLFMSNPTEPAEVVEIQEPVYYIVIDEVEEVEEDEVEEEEVVVPEKQYMSLQLPSQATGSFKTYMDYRAITNTRSEQWKLQQLAVTDENGFRKYDGKYMVAVGSYYAKSCGKELTVTLDTGQVIEVIVGDLKQDIHTDSTNRYVNHNGNILEFIVETSKLDSLSKKMGDVSYSGLQGSIIKIEEEIK